LSRIANVTQRRQASATDADLPVAQNHWRVPNQ
jgi:hypothetical protein